LSPQTEEAKPTMANPLLWCITNVRQGFSLVKFAEV
jgi:hypothetical protein